MNLSGLFLKAAGESAQNIEKAAKTLVSELFENRS
jgi:hypothetical protein